MDTEEITKLVDNTYKNILEKFNPSARQLITAGKAYLKALHGASSASRIFNEALAKIAINAQQGGTSDIGAALMNIVGVHKEIQDHHMNILKAFYVDLLVPLETNLEKDTKVIQFEQKKFLQQHKIKSENLSKATATMKKNKKKKNNIEKELKSIQAMEEEKQKLDLFCEQNLKNAITQERRRYGFVLERQCSLAKHWMAYYQAGAEAIDSSLESWNEVATTREFLPSNVENFFGQKDMSHFMSHRETDQGYAGSALRKTKSIDASCMDVRSISECLGPTMRMMPRAKSDFNLTMESSLEMAPWGRNVVKALFAYLSSGENQLSFLEGDDIALIGERAKGWQFGENLRTQKIGWFPIAYTDNENNSYESSKTPVPEIETDQAPDSSLEGTLIDDSVSTKMSSNYNESERASRKFGDTYQHKRTKQYQQAMVDQEMQLNPGPPPVGPAPVPSPKVPKSFVKKPVNQSQSFSSSNGLPMMEKRKTATTNLGKIPMGKVNPGARSGVASASLHSSNDSGFSNEPPPQPAIDYDFSDDETLQRVPIRSSQSERSLVTRQQRRNMSPSEEIYGTSNALHTLRSKSSYSNLANKHATIDLSTLDKQGKVKRNKSFWRFSKSEEILEGMALWKHRDLIQTDGEFNVHDFHQLNDTLRENSRPNLPEPRSAKPEAKPARPHPARPEGSLRPKKSGQKENKKKPPVKPVRAMAKEPSKDPAYYEKVTTDEEVYGQIIKTNNRTKAGRKNEEPGVSKSQDVSEWNEKVDAGYFQDSPAPGSARNFEEEDNFFDNESLQNVMMKSIKRKDILRQYYSSGTDSDNNSTSSDPYDCIVVDDHSMNKTNAKRDPNAYQSNDQTLDFSTFKGKWSGMSKTDRPTDSLLPRTKLTKEKKDADVKQSSNSSAPKPKQAKPAKRSSKHEGAQKPSYDGWNDLWVAKANE